MSLEEHLRADAESFADEVSEFDYPAILAEILDAAYREHESAGSLARGIADVLLTRATAALKLAA